jgi:two-component system sensor histidine kinase VicK
MTETGNHSIIRLIGSLTSDGVFIYNLKEEKLHYVNHSMVRIFDISHESFKYQPDFFVNHVIPEDIDHLLDEFEKFKANSFAENIEFHLKSHDKSIKTIVCNAFLIDDFAICFLRDVTMQRESERYIVNYGAKKDAMLDMITHNLSGPLNLTQHIADSLSKAIRDERNGEIKKHVAFIRETTEHCIHVVNDLLVEEHLTSEHISVKRTRFDVIEKVDNILERMRTADPEKQFILTSDVNALYINNDEVKFMQILQNLLSNAIKFTAGNGRVEVTVHKMATSFTVAVSDDGIGIPNHLEPLIFEKFTPAGRPGIRGERSIGMGLYIVRTLVSILGGKLTFDSKEGIGSRFIIQFPLD